MANLSILRNYAHKADISTLPTSVLFTHTHDTLTIFDAYPKSLFHFLVLPRVVKATSTLDSNEPSQKSDDPLTSSQLSSLATLLKCGPSRAKRELLRLKEEGLVCKNKMEEEMLERYGFKWDVWMGFHASPSMDHLHLHVISGDLTSPSLKNKKHYNSFHPSLGFFLHLDDVISWCDAESSYYDTTAQLKKSKYEPLLKESLVCFHCEQQMKNIPTLKVHLQEEWNTLAKKSKENVRVEEKLETKKRKRTPIEEPTVNNVDLDADQPESASKRRQTSSEV